MEGGAASALLDDAGRTGVLRRAAVACARSAHDERFRPQIEPYLRALDDAMEHDDFAQAMEMIEALRPALELSPLSRFALHVHSAEGWAQMRSAFAGVTAGTRAPSRFCAEHSTTSSRAFTANCIARPRPGLQTPMRRDQPGDLLHAIEAYRSAAVSRMRRPIPSARRACICAWVSCIIISRARAARSRPSARACAA